MHALYIVAGGPVAAEGFGLVGWGLVVVDGHVCGGYIAVHCSFRLGARGGGLLLVRRIGSCNVGLEIWDRSMWRKMVIFM